jgi:hypothetical protein
MSDSAHDTLLIELQIARGRFLDRYNMIEYHLAMLYCLLQSCHHDHAFWLIERTRDKRFFYEMIDSLLKISSIAECIPFWKKITSKLQHSDAFRNKIVHWKSGVTKRNGNEQPCLVPLSKSPGKNSHFIFQYDIEKYFEQLHINANLVNIISAYYMSKPNDRQYFSAVLQEDPSAKSVNRYFEIVKKIVEKPK